MGWFGIKSTHRPWHPTTYQVGNLGQNYLTPKSFSFLPCKLEMLTVYLIGFWEGWSYWCKAQGLAQRKLSLVGNGASPEWKEAKTLSPTLPPSTAASEPPSSVRQSSHPLSEWAIEHSFLCIFLQTLCLDNKYIFSLTFTFSFGIFHLINLSHVLWAMLPFLSIPSEASLGGLLLCWTQWRPHQGQTMTVASSGPWWGVHRLEPRAHQLTRVRVAWVQILVLPFTRYVTLGRLPPSLCHFLMER